MKKICNRLFENFKGNKIISISLFLFLIILVGSLTYAIWVKTLTSNLNTITSGVVSMSFAESSNVIKIENALPMNDSEGKELTNYFDFNVTSNLTLNSGDSGTDVSYGIEIQKLELDTGYTALSDNQVKVYLEDITNTPNELVEPTLISNLISTEDGKLLYTKVHNHIYGLNTINTKYRLRVWIDIDVSANDFKTISYEYKFKININGDVSMATPPTIYSTIADNVNAAPTINYQNINGSDNGNGLFLYTNNSGIDDNNGDKDIYYYRGNVTDNNVLFGGFCWKIIRTTSTGGTKMIYNGTPSDGKCNNTGSTTQISSSYFGNDYSSLADVGYMYGTRYGDNSKLISLNTSSTKVLSYNSSMNSTSYYYYDDASFTNSKVITWSTNYENAVGKWTCFLTDESTCTTPYYVAASTSSYAYYNTDGKSSIIMATSVTYSNSTYTLSDPTTIDLKDYYKYYSNYKNKYSCSDLTSTSCSTIYYNTDVTNTSVTRANFNNGYTYDTYAYVYGNSVTYSDGMYTLQNTTTSKPSLWSSERTRLANGYHYTCLNVSGTCSSVYYIFSFENSYGAYYLIFTSGDTLETAKTKMFTNTNDSKIKTVVDNWYKSNLLSYSNYLENTIFCNDRSFSSDYSGGTLSGESVNNSTTYSYFAARERMYVTYSPSLTCTNQNDRFSLSVSSGGTNNYGNNALTYPVGLITADEVNLAGGTNVNNSNYYLYTGNDYWTLSPMNYTGSARVYLISSSGARNSNITYAYSYGVRPVISLKYGIEFASGDGTVNNPYTVKEISE